MAKKQKAEQATEPQVETPAAEAPAAEEVKSRGPRGVAETAKITLLAKTNPKREGSKAHARFAAYRDGQSVGEALDAGVTTPDLVYDAKHGFIHIESYDPGEIVQPKVREPKAPKEPKSTKGGKVKAEKTAEQVESEAAIAAETVAETIE